jgi:asparagine synthase (glutamine-hydrolysing)
LIVDLKNGVPGAEIAALGGSLQGTKSPLRLYPTEPSTSRRAAAAAVRMPGFLPEDRYDRQPLWSADRGTLFVCQARLDNRDELLGALDLSGLPPDEIADSTILHAAYRHWGEDCMAHLSGDYAFAAYSSATPRVFAAVDHIAHYRLYYAAHGSRIVLCTQLASLRKHERDPLDVDTVALGLSAEARYLPGATPFHNIRQLLGGECLSWNTGALNTRGWWHPETRPLTRFQDSSEYVEATRDIFERAVCSCLRSTNPVSATLSGGLDSGLVTATAAHLLRRSGHSVTAYTSAPPLGNRVFERPRWDADDAPFAAQTATFHSNISHVILRSDGRVALDLLSQIHRCCATPVRNGANHVWLDSIARTAGPGVILTGARGNFSLSYAGAGGFAELLRRWRWKAALHCATDARDAEGKPLWKTFASGILPRGVFEFLRSRLYDEKVEALSLTTHAFRQRHRDALHPRHSSPGTRDAFLRRAMLANITWAADPLPLWGVEWRDPTADRRLLELLLSFPLAAFAHDGRPRGLARSVARDLLPDAIRLRRTQGQQSSDYATAMAQNLPRYRAAQERMEASDGCRRVFDLSALQSALGRIAAGELSGAITGSIDRCIDAGLFLADMEAT